MGGSVTMIIKKDNKVKKMCRWTNALPAFFFSRKFLFQDDFYIKNYIKVYEEMEKDYERNKDTKNFNFNMTDAYVPYGGVFAPVDYGIVFVDFDDKHVYSCQGYTKIFSRHSTYIRQDLEDNHEDGVEAEALFKEGFLSVRKIDHPDYKEINKTLQKEFKQAKSLKDFFKNIEKYRETSLVTFEINHENHFKVTHLHDDTESFKELFKIFKEKDLLSKEDVKLWKKYIKERE